MTTYHVANHMHEHAAKLQHKTQQNNLISRNLNKKTNDLDIRIQGEGRKSQ